MSIDSYIQNRTDSRTPVGSIPELQITTKKMKVDNIVFRSLEEPTAITQDMIEQGIPR